MQSEKDKIMELLTITEVKEGGEVIFTDRSIEILQELGQQYRETPLFKKSRQDRAIKKMDFKEAQRVITGGKNR